MIFVREVRSKISKANPDMPVLQIMKEVGYKWQNLTSSEKKIYQDMADTDKIRYKDELKDFEKEVEKLHVSKPTKGKSSNKSKNSIKSSPIIKPVTKSIPLFEQFTQGYSEVLSKQQSFLTLEQTENKIKEKWDNFSESDKIKYTKNPELLIELPKLIEEKVERETPKEMQIPDSRLKDDNLIKRPLNITKPDNNIFSPKALGSNKTLQEVPKYKMQPDPFYYKNNDNDAPAVAIDYKMTTDLGDKEEYNRIFPEGKSPPILDNRKRNRRLSSIVGIRSQHYGSGFDVDEILEPKTNDTRRPDSRSASIDFNMPSEPNADSPYLMDQRKSGVYLFAGIPHQSPIETHFAQHPMFKPTYDLRMNYRKQSNNLPDSTSADFKPFTFGNYNAP